MSIQQLLAQLSGMGLGEEGFGATGADVAAQLCEQYDLLSETDDAGVFNNLLTQQMFQPINPELIKSASIGAYSPLFQQKQSSLLPQLMAKMGGTDARKAFGGFAGSGGAQMQQQQAKDIYGQGMGDVLSQAMGAKTQSLGTIQDVINQWQQTAQSFVGSDI